MSNKLQKRLTYLRNAEAIFALTLPPIFSYYWLSSALPIAWPLRLSALTLVSYLLLQGAVYWQLKLTTVRNRLDFPGYFPTLFLLFKISNLGLFSLFALLWCWAWQQGAAPADLAWSGALFCFAVLEHINYYSHQLMYDTAGAISALKRNGRLRKAALAIDLAKVAEATATQ